MSLQQIRMAHTDNWYEVLANMRATVANDQRRPKFLGAARPPSPRSVSVGKPTKPKKQLSPEQAFLGKVRRIAARYPNLTTGGFVELEPTPHKVSDLGVERLPVGDSITEPETLRQIKACCEFLTKFGLTDEVDRSPPFNSYHIKHEVEDWLRIEGRSAYISQGALIVAALVVGARWARAGKNKHVFIGVSRQARKHFFDAAKR